MLSLPVARTECRRYLRGKPPWLIFVAFLLASRMAIQPTSRELNFLDGAAALVNAQVATTVVVPFAAAVIGFRAITKERDSGTARLILGTKTTRTQFVLNVILGRGAALFAPILAGTLLVAAYDSIRYGYLSIPLLVGFLALAALYVYTWLALIIGLSAASSSTTRAIILGSVTTLALLIWNEVTSSFVWQLATGTTPGPNMVNQTTYQIVTWLSPLSAFQVLTNWLLGVPIGTGNAVAQLTDALSETGVLTVTSPPLPAWWAFAFLLGWPLLSVLGGIAYFQRTDLAIDSQHRVVETLRRYIPSMPRSRTRIMNRLTGRGGVVDSLPGTWQPVARREFHRLIRTPLVWTVGALVFLASVLSLSPPAYAREILGARIPLASLQRPLIFIGGIGVLFGTFRAVNHERDTGSIRFTAGTAVSRAGTLVGCTLGRAGAFVIPVITGGLLTCLLAVPRYGVVPVGRLAVFLVFAVVFVGVLAGIGVAISTIVRSQAVAGFTVLVFVGGQILWFQIANAIYEAIFGVSVSGFEPPSNPVFLFIRWLPPFQLSNVVTNAIIGVPNSAAQAVGVLRDLQPNQFSNLVVARLAYGSDVPAWYLHPGVAFVQLLLWVVVPLGAAVWFYRSRDLD